MADYPTSIPSFTAKVNGDIFDAPNLNDTQDELRAIALELGTLPKGAFADVKTRLNLLEALGYNFAINGGFNISQRGSAFTNPALNAYTLDRWKVLEKSGTTPPSVNIAFAGTFNSGATGPNALDISVTGAGSADSVYRLMQPADITLPDVTRLLGGLTVTFAMDVNVPAGYASKVHLRIEDGAGATDSGVAGAGITRLSVTRTIQLSTAFLRFGVRIAPVDTVALISISGAVLSIGNVASWRGLDGPIEVLRCQRFYQKSYNLGVAPGTVTIVGAPHYRGHAPDGETPIHFRARMRTTPTMTIYSPATGASGFGRNNSVAADRAATLEAVGEYGASVFFSAGVANGESMSFHFTADAEV